MAELVDALDSGSSGLAPIGVQLPSSTPLLLKAALPLVMVCFFCLAASPAGTRARLAVAFLFLLSPLALFGYCLIIFLPFAFVIMLYDFSSVSLFYHAAAQDPAEQSFARKKADPECLCDNARVIFLAYLGHLKHNAVAEFQLGARLD